MRLRLFLASSSEGSWLANAKMLLCKIFPLHSWSFLSYLASLWLVAFSDISVLLMQSPFGVLMHNLLAILLYNLVLPALAEDSS